MSSTTSTRTFTALHGWLDNFLPKPYDESEAAADEAKRRLQYPEQYPATYDLLPPEACLPSDSKNEIVALVRPLLKQTQLERRVLRAAYDADQHGWDGAIFHSKVDGCGAAVVLATTEDGRMVGGYNPKGWSGLGGARPSVAAFLFYEKGAPSTPATARFQKLCKVGGGGLACANDDPTGGIYFGPDGLVVPLINPNDGAAASSQPARTRITQSKLGPYYERGPDNRSSLLDGGVATLKDLKVLVGVYEDGEDIPYSGAVLDMTSG